MSSALANIYARLPVSFTHGRGVWLWDTGERRYLDALAGIGVSCLGHGHPGLVAAISNRPRGSSTRPISTRCRNRRPWRAAWPSCPA